MTEVTDNSRTLTPLQRLQLNYWCAFRDLALARSTVIKARKPQPQPHRFGHRSTPTRVGKT